MMKTFLCLSALCLLFACQEKKNDDLILWYNEPATEWNDALPIGNGHAGAMVFGGVEREQISLNENTLYSGEPSVVFKDIKVTSQSLDKVVALLKGGKYVEAYEDVVSKEWLGRLHQYYQPFGDLFIQNNKQGEITSYKRELNISEAMATTQFEQSGITYTREIFASHSDNIIVMRLNSSQKGAIDITLQFTSPHPTASQVIDNDRLVLKGQAPGYVERRTFEQMETWGDQYKHPELYDEKGNRKFDKRVLYGDEIEGKGMFFEAQLQPFFPSSKGELTWTDEGLHVSGTDEVYLVLVLATSYNGYDKSPSREGVDPSVKAQQLIDAVKSTDYKTLRQRHLNDYKELFDRVSLSLPSGEEQKALPTDERIIRFGTKDDPDLAALLFQYGRYLMISGSRPGGQPLNLQGMWNKEIVPPWNSGYTQNINTEMNYWPAEVTNLSECHEPLFRMVRELSVTGTETARNMYGRRGWVAHHNTSLWRESLPNDNVATASFWPMVQGWLTSHLWEHYLFQADTLFLKEQAYPLMKGAAEFYADWLVEDGEGHLVTPAGVSPENWFFTPEGQRAALSMGPTMDMALIKETFIRVIEASAILGVDDDLRKELKEKQARLLPYRIGGKGQLQEWMYDFTATDPKHRHLSHLYGFHPGDQITVDKTPELFNAVKQSLLLRGDEATGWSMGWKINCWARMLDGNHAYAIIKNLFNPVGFGPQTKEGGHSGGGLYKSMLDAHPPFQIDGNFGYTAGVAEMLVQSHAGYIQLLPALPDVWTEGTVTGLKMRGDFELSSMEWKEGSLQEAEIVSHSGNMCRLRCPEPFIIKQKNSSITSSPIEVGNKIYYEASFETGKANTYKILPLTI